MLLEEFDYSLPPELIAQRPLASRHASRMMILERGRKTFRDQVFRELAQILRPDDLLVFNNTKVFPARLLGRRRGTHAQPVSKRNPAAGKFLSGEVELLLAGQESEDVWEGLVHPGRKVKSGEVLLFGEGELQAEVIGRRDYGLRRVRLTAREGSVEDAIDRLGHVPLPPYIRRADEASDRETYQTIYAKARGAVAAPTAGLHFTAEVMDELRRGGIETCEITLHVGLGTFQPVRCERVEAHRMEAEQYEISEAAAVTLNRALEDGRRIVAVGTTSVRTLEHVAREHGGRIEPGRGKTNLFIYPGFDFRVTRGLLTNFHLPRSTLLMLVCALAGRELTLLAYQHAVREHYRFYSYGDCMLVV